MTPLFIVINPRTVAIIIEFIEAPCRRHHRYQIMAVVLTTLKEAAAEAMVALLNVEIDNLSEMIVWLVDPIILPPPSRLPIIIETTTKVVLLVADQ